MTLSFRHGARAGETSRPGGQPRSLFVWSTFILLWLSMTPVALAHEAVIYQIRPGDTLSHIAREYNTSVKELLELNRLADPNLIRAGEPLVVYVEPQRHTVMPGESLWVIARRYGVTTSALVAFNDLSEPDHIVVGQTLIIPPAGGSDVLSTLTRSTRFDAVTLRWPLNGGMLTSLFGPRNDRLHKGIDIAAPQGTPVLAAADGRVTYADWAGTYGILVEIEHDGGVVTRYAHNSRLRVRPGQTVRAGQHIADVGSTGRSTGPHVHFEVEIRGEAVDPLLYLPSR